MQILQKQYLYINRSGKNGYHTCSTEARQPPTLTVCSRMAYKPILCVIYLEYVQDTPKYVKYSAQYGKFKASYFLMIEFYTWQPPLPRRAFPTCSFSSITLVSFFRLLAHVLFHMNVSANSHQSLQFHHSMLKPEFLAYQFIQILMFFHHNVSRQCNLIILHL